MPRTALRFTAALVLALTAAASAPSAFSADKKDATPVMAPAPPPAMPQNVKVTRGQKVEIPLRTFGRHAEPLRYLIRSMPQHGRLSEPRAVEREVSMVTYEPPADLAVTSDRFRFSVKTSVGVSAPVEVTIAIVDDAPVLAIPNVLDFGSILAGATLSREFELANRGGGIAEGELKVKPPWTVEGRKTYQLAREEFAIFKVAFAPTEGGQFSGELVFTSNLEHTTALAGTAAMPLEVEPATLALQHQPGFALRSGVFEIINRTDEARTFRLSASPRLRVESQVSVPAKGRLAVAVSTLATDVAPLDDAVKVDTEGVSLRLPVKSPPVGPILRVGQERITLGRLPASSGGQIAVEVENVGGTPAAVASAISAPFALTPANFLLAPGEKRRVTLAIQPAEAGPYRTWLKLTAPPMSAEVEVSAELSEVFGKGRPSTAAARRTSPATRTREPSVEDPPESMPDLTFAKAIRVTEVRATSAKIEWPAEMNPATKFRIERLRIERNPAGGVSNVWIEVPHVTFSEDGSQRFARITGLKAQSSQTMRVTSLDPEGNPGAPLFVIDFFTPPKSPGLRLPSLLQALIGGLVICLGIFAWKRLREQRGVMG